MGVLGSRPLGDYRINVRVDGVVRNAFSLTAMRYQVPITRIVELAPLLFVLVAEASLERRRAKLAELKEALSRAGTLAEDFPYLPNSIRADFSAEDAFLAEERSIEKRDIMANRLPDDIFWLHDAVDPDYDEGEHNPFVLYLRQASPAAPLASLSRFDRSSTEYEVCREDALKLADGHEDLADSILDGVAMLHDMPRDLLDPDAGDARTAWLREKWEACRANMLNLDDILEGTPDEENAP